MKRNNRYGAVVQCDVVKRTETEEEIIDTEQCDQKFHTGSISRLARAQAKDKKWLRPKVKLVRWPGLPPLADNKKVDICPKHAKLVMTEDEYKEHKKAEREKAKAAKAEKKAKSPRKKKPTAAGDAASTTPF